MLKKYPSYVIHSSKKLKFTHFMFLYLTTLVKNPTHGICCWGENLQNEQNENKIEKDKSTFSIEENDKAINIFFGPIIKNGGLVYKGKNIKKKNYDEIFSEENFSKKNIKNNDLIKEIINVVTKISEHNNENILNTTEKNAKGQTVYMYTFENVRSCEPREKKDVLLDYITYDIEAYNNYKDRQISDFTISITKYKSNAKNAIDLYIDYSNIHGSITYELPCSNIISIDVNRDIKKQIRVAFENGCGNGLLKAIKRFYEEDSDKYKDNTVYHSCKR